MSDVSIRRKGAESAASRAHSLWGHEGRQQGGLSKRLYSDISFIAPSSDVATAGSVIVLLDFNSV